MLKALRSGAFLVSCCVSLLHTFMSVASYNRCTIPNESLKMLIHRVFVCLLILANVFTISRAEVKMFDTAIYRIREVRNLYRAANILLIHDESHPDWREHAAKAVWTMSRMDIMSQSISRSQLIEAPIQFSEFTHATGTMVVIALSGPQDYEFLRLAMYLKVDTVHVWLLVVRGSNCKRPVGNPLDLRIDSQLVVYCVNDATLKAYYSLGRNGTEQKIVGHWESDSHFHVIDKTELYVMRNLKGITLKASKVEPPKEHLEYYMYKNFFVEDLLSELERIGKFSTRILEVPDQTANLEAVTSGEVDIGLSLTAMTASRTNYLDFATPVAESRFRIYAKLPDEPRVSWKAYIRVFNLIEWVCLLLTVLCAVVTWVLIKALLWRTALSGMLIIDSVTDVWGVFIQKGILKAEVLTHLSTRIFYVTLMLSATITYNIYSATITSYITVLKPKLPFSNFQEFFNNTDYKLTTLPYSATEYFLDPKFWLYNSIRPRLEDLDKLSTDVHKSVERVCSEDLAVTMHYLNFKSSTNQMPCILGYVTLPLVERISITLPKYSPYTNIINYNILRLYDMGVIKRLKQIYFYERIDEPKNELVFIDISDFIPILMIWIFGAVVSLLVLYSEITLYNRQRRRQHLKRLRRRVRGRNVW